MVIDTSVIVAAAAGLQIIITIGGGFYFFGRLSTRLDEQDKKIDELKDELHDIRELVTSVAAQGQLLVTGEAVQNNRLDYAEKTIDDLRRGVGFIRDGSARSIDREYGR